MSVSVIGLCSFFMTVGVYYSCKLLYKRIPWICFSPVLLTPIIVLTVVELCAIPLPEYFIYNHWLTMMLGPATIAFALPIYRQREIIKMFPLTLVAGIASGVIIGLLVNYACARLFSLPELLTKSILPRSVSTPFSMQATTMFGGEPDVTALLALCTGIVGMIISDSVFRIFRVNSPHAKGAALGAAAHGGGTARAFQMGPQHGVIASLTMIFAGIIMVLISPVIVFFLK